MAQLQRPCGHSRAIGNLRPHEGAGQGAAAPVRRVAVAGRARPPAVLPRCTRGGGSAVRTGHRRRARPSLRPGTRRAPPAERVPSTHPKPSPFSRAAGPISSSHGARPCSSRPCSRSPAHGTYVPPPRHLPRVPQRRRLLLALASGDLNRVGLTLLRIDAGVDTGPSTATSAIRSTSDRKATCGSNSACSPRTWMPIRESAARGRDRARGAHRDAGRRSARLGRSRG